MKYTFQLSIFIWAILMLVLGLTSDDHKITSMQAKSALNIMGLEMEDAEIDSLLDGLNSYRKAYIEMRETNIPNEISPSLYFNPLPVGFEIDRIQQVLRFEEYDQVSLPEDKTEMAFYSIGQLGVLLRSGAISSVELTRFFQDRLKNYDQTLHCVIRLTEELALMQAARADDELARGIDRGPLHGIPYGAKDLLATKDYKTTWGATPFKEQEMDYDATVIRKLEEAGAVLVAKLTLGALAWGDVWYGETTRNPWDTEKGSSGSSAGSASAVSAGLVPFAIGTETLGSIVSPSTVCGTTGLRPTFGRVSRHGAMALSWSMDKIGPITRSAEDCAIVLDAIRGPDEKDMTTNHAAFNYNSYRKTSDLKIGFLQTVFDSEYAFKSQDSITLEKLRNAGYDLVPINLPQMPSLMHILTAEAAAAFDELTRSGRDDLLVRQIKNAWPNTFREARFIPAVEYIQANRIRSQLIQKMDSLMQEVDLYLTPSWAGTNLQLTNLTGHPQLVIPNGFHEGTPTSISIVGQLFGEASLLEFGKAVQEITGFHEMHPPDFK